MNCDPVASPPGKTSPMAPDLNERKSIAMACSPHRVGLRRCVVGFLPALILTILPVAGCESRSGPPSAVVKPDYAAARQRMVETQLKSPGRNIRDPRVLDAMRDVPRHEFVPENLRADAYEDYPLPIGYGQTISQPTSWPI